MLEKLQLPLDEIKEMFEEGYCAREIAEIYYVSSGTIYKRFKELGLSARKRSEDRIKYVKEKVKELYCNNDITIKEIAEQLKVQETVIYRHAREMKLHRKRKVQYINDIVGKEKFIEIYNEYDTYREVAEYFNISISSARTFAIKLGLPLKKHNFKKMKLKI